jgi:hypothetical protein
MSVSMEHMNVSDKTEQLSYLAETLRVTVQNNPGVNFKKALVETVRREGVPLADMYYALTYARHYGIVVVDSHTQKITVGSA